MAFIDNTGNKELKLVLTNWGKEEALKYGILKQIKYFSVNDSGVLYTQDVLPDKLKDYSGYHDNSTALITNCKYKIKINE